MRGKFITFEGPEGCGKTTQSKLVMEWLKSKGQDVIWTREPGGTRIGDAIRALVLDPEYGEMVDLTEILLLSASRAQHVKEKIVPALEAGKTVLCDRFVDATLAYQGRGRGMDWQLLGTLNEIATEGLMPDITMLIDISPEIGLKRAMEVDKAEAAAGEADRFEAAGGDFHRSVRDGYLYLAEHFPERIKVVKSRATVDETQEEIRRILSDVLF
ncbi:MAG: dTMP kinase [Candidatus Tritonobacter lacicola]|nr:dTMP kinase [Candidatus Tritonobacter lacicola]